MCECPGDQCHCEVLTAYARECERRAGIIVHNWREATGCLNVSSFKWDGRRDIYRVRANRSSINEISEVKYDKKQHLDDKAGGKVGEYLAGKLKQCLFSSFMAIVTVIFFLLKVALYPMLSIASRSPIPPPPSSRHRSRKRKRRGDSKGGNYVCRNVSSVGGSGRRCVKSSPSSCSHISDDPAEADGKRSGMGDQGLIQRGCCAEIPRVSCLSGRDDDSLHSRLC